MNRQSERIDDPGEKQASYRLDPAGHADVARAGFLELGDIGDRVGVDERAVPAQVAAQGLADDVLAHRVDELPERVVGVHGRPELRPLLPELAADDDVSDAADRLAHQLALFRAEGVELPQVRRLDDAVRRAEQVCGRTAGHCVSFVGAAAVTYFDVGRGRNSSPPGEHALDGIYVCRHTRQAW